MLDVNYTVEFLEDNVWCPDYNLDGLVQLFPTLDAAIQHMDGFTYTPPEYKRIVNIATHTKVLTWDQVQIHRKGEFSV